MVSYTDQSCLRGPGQCPCLCQSSPSCPATLCPTNTTSPALIPQSKFAETKAQDTNGLIEWSNDALSEPGNIFRRLQYNHQHKWLRGQLSAQKFPESEPHFRVFRSKYLTIQLFFHIRNLSPSDLIILISIHKTNEIMSRNKTK